MSRPLALVVDDEPTIVEVVELYLRREGFEVLTAADGPSALAALERRPDLVVLDLMLPGVSGLEITGRLRAAGRLPLSEAILAVSGRLGFEIVQKAIVAGVPLVVSVGAASTLAVALAERHGLALATFVRPGAMNLYGAAARVEPGPG